MVKPKNMDEVIAGFLWLQQQLNAFQERFSWLEDQIMGVRLDRRQLLQRYGWSDCTLRRRLFDGSIPKPIQFGGRPCWRLGDLAKAELTGQLPRPVSA